MLLELYAAITRLMMSAPCHLSLLPNCIGDMERVHNEDDLLMLSLPGQIFMQRSTRYRMELVWRDFTWCKSLAQRGNENPLGSLGTGVLDARTTTVCPGWTAASCPGKSSWKPGMTTIVAEFWNEEADVNQVL